jgi:hypothetical protein
MRGAAYRQDPASIRPRAYAEEVKVPAVNLRGTLRGGGRGEKKEEEGKRAPGRYNVDGFSRRPWILVLAAHSQLLSDPVLIANEPPFCRSRFKVF